VAYVAFGSGERVTADIWVLPLTGDRKPFPFLTSGYQETQPRISPDGRWMAYVSNESGKDYVYISSFPTPASRSQSRRTAASNRAGGRMERSFSICRQIRN
jgi:Tol biopolymer transport system component